MPIDQPLRCSDLAVTVATESFKAVKSPSLTCSPDASLPQLSRSSHSLVYAALTPHRFTAASSEQSDSEEPIVFGCVFVLLNGQTRVQCHVADLYPAIMEGAVLMSAPILVKNKDVVVDGTA